MAGIFISYRRDDTQGEARHLAEDLRRRFPDQVFMDVLGIDPGKDYRHALENAVASARVLIVMIGRQWLTVNDAAGRRRLDSDGDYVRIEAASALRRGIDVIPVLVQGAVMPTPEQLPKDLESLCWRQKFELRHDRWAPDVADLVRALEKVVDPSRKLRIRAMVWAGGGLLAAAAVALGVQVWPGPGGEGDSVNEASAPGAASAVQEAATTAKMGVAPSSARPPAPRVELAPPVQKAAARPEPQSPVAAPAAAPAAAPPPVAALKSREVTAVHRVRRGGGPANTQQSAALDETIPVDTQGVLRVAVALGSGACSEVRFHLFVDGRKVTTTPFVRDYLDEVDLGPVTPGTRRLTVSPEGKTGGCNQGWLESWAGQVTVVASRLE